MMQDRLADPKGGTIRGLRGPGGILLHSLDLSRHARLLNRYRPLTRLIERERGLGAFVRHDPTEAQLAANRSTER